MAEYVNVNLRIDDRTNRTLGVIKEMYGLKDKSMALMFFIEKFGKDLVEPRVKDEVVKEMVEGIKRHEQKYGLKTQTIDELRKEIERAEY